MILYDHILSRHPPGPLPSPFKTKVYNKSFVNVGALPPDITVRTLLSFNQLKYEGFDKQWWGIDNQFIAWTV